MTLTKEEADRLEKGLEDRARRLDSRAIRTAGAAERRRGSTGAAGNVGGYNNFWLEPGDRVAVVKANGEARSSWIPPTARSRR